MAVRIKFDSTHNIIPPTLVFANRSGHKQGYIPATNISVSDSFNANFDLEFQVIKQDNGKEYCSWESITDFKLCWCKEWDVWFEMHVEIEDDNDTVKKVSCISLGEAELSRIMIYGTEINTEDDIARKDYEPTILFNNDNPDASLLNRVMEKAPHYRIKHVDSSIARIQRTFSFDGKSLYDVFQEIAEEIGCIFIIDSGSNDDGSISRSISVFDLESYCRDCGHRDNFSGRCPKCGSDNIMHGYGEDTNVFVSTENLANSINLRTDVDSVRNCFRLEAGDDLMTATIKNCNPNGSQYIWYISDSVKSDMSEELSAKLTEYDELYSYYQNRHTTILDSKVLNKYNELVTKYRQYNENLHTLSDSIAGYPDLMTAFYDTIDMYLFLHDTLMPSPELVATDAAIEAARLNSTALSPVSVQDLSKCSSYTASSAVLSVAKTIVDPRYQVKLKSGTLNGNVWEGNFTVTSYTDESDTADSILTQVSIDENYENFIRQKIDKVLNSNALEDNSSTDIVSLFKLPHSDFVAEIKKYCLVSLTSFYDSCQSCLDILIEQGIANNETWANKTPDLYSSLYIPYYNKLSALQDEIKLRESEIEVISGTYDSDGDLKIHGIQSLIEDEKAKIQDALDMENYLGSDLWLEFVAYRREDTYSNENYISDGLDNGELFNRALEFIEAARKEIYKSATLQHSLSASLKNLLVMKEFLPIVDKFSVGNWIRIKIDDEVYRLRLINYQIDFDNLEDLSVEFSDVIKIKDGVTDIESVLSEASNMASSYDSVKKQSIKAVKKSDMIDGWVKDGLDATHTKIVSNVDNQEQTWDKHGMLFRKYNPITDDYSDTQLKIINSTIAITDNNWKSTKTAIGNFLYVDPTTKELTSAYGVNGESIVGKLILGEQLGIYNTTESLTFDKNGLKVSNGKNAVTIDPNSRSLFNIKKGNDYLLSITDEGELNIVGNIVAKNLTLTEGAVIVGLSDTITKITNDAISTASINADQITTGTLSAERVGAGSFTITGGSIDIDVSDTTPTTSSRPDDRIRLRWLNSKGVVQTVKMSANSCYYYEGTTGNDSESTRTGIYNGYLYEKGELLSSRYSKPGHTHSGETIRPQKLYVTGESSLDSGVANVRMIRSGANKGQIVFLTNASSKRFKHDIHPLSEEQKASFRKLYDVEVKNWKYNEDYIGKSSNGLGKERYGLIAEDVAEFIPEAVFNDEEGNIENYDDRKILNAMLFLIQDQKQQIDSQEKRIEELERVLEQ